MFIFKNIMLGIFIFLTSPYATAGNFCLYLLGIYFYSGVGACVMGSGGRIIPVFSSESPYKIFNLLDLVMLVVYHTLKV
jgi:hypothetical protein